MSLTYDREPEIPIKNRSGEAWRGYTAIAITLERQMIGQRKTVLVIECYPTVRTQEIIDGVSRFLSKPTHVIRAEQAAKSTEQIEAMIKRYMTDDRVFGYLAPFDITDYYDKSEGRSARYRCLPKR